jgi:hypothetical protein
MFSQVLSRVLIASVLLGTSISTSFAQNNDSDFIKIRNSYPFWNGSLKRDIQGFKPGMTESEAKQRLSDCEVSGQKILCPVSSKDERFELSLTEHTRPRLVKEVTYDFPAGGATLETMAKNVVMQFGAGSSQQCVPSPQGISQCSQWQLGSEQKWPTGGKISGAGWKLRYLLGLSQGNLSFRASNKTAETPRKKPRTAAGLLLTSPKRVYRPQPRESRDSPRLNAFCRVAPSVRFRVRAMLAARVFFRAIVFNVRTSDDVHDRRFEFLGI